MFFYSIKTQLLLKTWGGLDSMNGPPSASWADEFHYLPVCARNQQKGTCGVDCSQRVQAVTDYICPVAVCNEQGGEGGGKRKKVCFSPGKSRQSYR